MKSLLSTVLSAAAVCAVVAAAPVAAQETVTGAPRGEAPITAEPPLAFGNAAVGGYVNAPLGAATAIVTLPFDAFAGAVGQAVQPQTRCHATRDFYGSQGRYTSVCNL